MMCASSGFRAAFTGSGGHASQPHQIEDTVLSAAKFITDAQIVTSRLINQAEPLTITVSTIHGGEAGRANIIPKRVDFEGTIRTPKRETHAEIHEDLRRIIRAIELTTGVKGEITFRNGSDAVMNDPGLTELFLQARPDFSAQRTFRSPPRPIWARTISPGTGNSRRRSISAWAFRSRTPKRSTACIRPSSPQTTRPSARARRR